MKVINIKRNITCNIKRNITYNIKCNKHIHQCFRPEPIMA